MEASPAAMPAISGTERRNPKFAPDAAASVVAPPGLSVDTSTNRRRGVGEASGIGFPDGRAQASAPAVALETNAGHGSHQRA